MLIYFTNLCRELPGYIFLIWYKLAKKFYIVLTIFDNTSRKLLTDMENKKGGVYFHILPVSPFMWWYRFWVVREGIGEGGGEGDRLAGGIVL